VAGTLEVLAGFHAQPTEGRSLTLLPPLDPAQQAMPAGFLASASCGRAASGNSGTPRLTAVPGLGQRQSGLAGSGPSPRWGRLAGPGRSSWLVSRDSDTAQETVRIPPYRCRHQIAAQGRPAMTSQLASRTTSGTGVNGWPRTRTRPEAHGAAIRPLSGVRVPRADRSVTLDVPRSLVPSAQGPARHGVGHPAVRRRSTQPGAPARHPSRDQHMLSGPRSPTVRQACLTDTRIKALLVE